MATVLRIVLILLRRKEFVPFRPHSQCTRACWPAGGLCPLGLPLWMQTFVGSSILSIRAAVGQVLWILTPISKCPATPAAPQNISEVQLQPPGSRVVFHPGTLHRAVEGHQLLRGLLKLWPRTKIYLGVENQPFHTWSKKCVLAQEGCSCQCLSILLDPVGRSLMVLGRGVSLCPKLLTKHHGTFPHFVRSASSIFFQGSDKFSFAHWE